MDETFLYQAAASILAAYNVGGWWAGRKGGKAAASNSLDIHAEEAETLDQDVKNYVDGILAVGEAKLKDNLNSAVTKALNV